jgi:transcriptional regulator with XRE-family HTH domain
LAILIKDIGQPDSARTEQEVLCGASRLATRRTAREEHLPAVSLISLELADHIKMHRSQYGFLEQGKKGARLSTVERVCQGLGISMAKLMADVESDES